MLCLLLCYLCLLCVITISYRQLLNRWQLWSERAKLDVHRSMLYSEYQNNLQNNNNSNTATSRAAQTSNKPPCSSVSATALSSASAASSASSLHRLLPLTQSHIYARCTYCGSPLHYDQMNVRQGLGQRSGVFRRSKPDGLTGSSSAPSDAASVRVRCCPHCKKSLPKCALCLVSLDAAMATNSQQQTDRDRGGNRLTINSSSPAQQGSSSVRFDLSVSSSSSSGTSAAAVASYVDSFSVHPSSDFHHWFAWCQHCRHGGHAQHLRDWFEQHDECPVHDCHCHCTSKD